MKAIPASKHYSKEHEENLMRRIEKSPIKSSLAVPNPGRGEKGGQAVINPSHNKVPPSKIKEGKK